MLSLFCGLAVTIAAPTTSSVTSEWNLFKKTYGKTYSAEEEVARVAIFEENLAIADDLTQKSAADGGSAVHGVTKFMDLSKEEFKKMYLSKYVSSSDKSTAAEWTAPHTSKVATPTKKDWYMNLTTAVKDQGQCGSCWAFSATEQLESMAIKNRMLRTNEPLAVQQIVSCDKNQDQGCNGGDTETAYKYIERAGGLELQTRFPYTSGVTGMTGWCLDRDRPQLSKAADLTAWNLVGKHDEGTMQKYIANEGPLSICVDASSWQTYKRGVITRVTCGLQIDHCVQLTGYDFSKTEFKSEAWLVRNSWNTDWGMKGFIALEYGSNTCALANEPTTVTPKVPKAEW